MLEVDKLHQSRIVAPELNVPEDAGPQTPPLIGTIVLPWRRTLPSHLWTSLSPWNHGSSYVFVANVIYFFRSAGLGRAP